MSRGLIIILTIFAGLATLPAAAEDYAWLGFAPEKERVKLVTQARRFDAAILAVSTEATAAESRYLELANLEQYDPGRPEASLDALLALGDAASALNSGGPALKARATEGEALRRLLAPYLAGLAPARWEALALALEARAPLAWKQRYPALGEIAAVLSKARADSGARALLARLFLAADAEAAAQVLAAPDKEGARVLGVLKLSSSAASLQAELTAARAWSAALAIARAPGLAARRDARPLGSALEALDALPPDRALALASSFKGDAAALTTAFLSALDPDARARFARALAVSPAQARMLERIFAPAGLRTLRFAKSSEAESLKPLPAYDPGRLEAAGKAIGAFRSAEALGADTLPSLRALFADPLARSLLASSPDLAPLAALALGTLEEHARARLSDPASGARSALAPLFGAAQAEALLTVRWSDPKRGLWKLELRVEGSAAPLRFADAATRGRILALLLESLIGKPARAGEALSAHGFPEGQQPEADWSPEAFAAAWQAGASEAMTLEDRGGVTRNDAAADWTHACDALLQRGSGTLLAELRAAEPAAHAALGSRLRSARAALANLQAFGELR